MARGAWDFGVLIIREDGGWVFLHLKVSVQAIPFDRICRRLAVQNQSQLLAAEPVSD